MTKVLPERPNLDHLKHEAKTVLKAHAAGDANCCAVLRNLRRFAGKPDAEILAAQLKLSEVQFALAIEYGFKDWTELIQTIEWKDPRVVTDSAVERRVAYVMQNIAPHRRREYMFPHADLTIEENFRNQFHNEVSSLQALASHPFIPRLRHVDADALTYVCDPCPNERTPPREVTEAILIAAADLYAIAETAAIPLRRSWHTLVPEDWYFAIPEHYREALARDGLSSVLAATPNLIKLSAAFPRRYAMIEQNDAKIAGDSDIRFTRFDCADIRWQMLGIVGILNECSYSGPFPTFKYWMDGWEAYARRRGNCTDADLREFLYLTVRTSSRRLSKHKPPAPAWRQWLIDRAAQSFDELQRLTPML